LPHIAMDNGQEVLRDQVFYRIGESLRSGRFAPGEKITIRALAQEENISPTPVREALYRLISDGVLEAEANRSARVPMLSGKQLRELRDIRLALEPLAAERAAANSTPALITTLRYLVVELASARERGFVASDLIKDYEFQFTLYRACEMPALIKLIEGLWLRTGPYLNLLYPDYVSRSKATIGNWRENICVALERNDAHAVRMEIEQVITEAVDYIANVVEAAKLLRPTRKPRNARL
jgi:DNA-binding GntR family transcriptional regulator